MPYRDHNSALPSDSHCYRHPSAPAQATCARCMQLICEPCLVYSQAAATCAVCVRAIKRGQLIVRGLGVALLAAVVIAGVLYVRSLPPYFDYGTYSIDVRDKRKKVEAERCDKAASLAYEEVLLEAGDNRGAIADVDAFTKKCGDWYRVHWNSYEAYRRLTDNANAIVEANELIAHDPNDSDYRWWRGIAYEDMGDFVKAEADYREAIRITPDLGNIPFNLANVLERQGKLCEAKKAIEDFVHQHPEAGTEEQVIGRVARLADRGKCP